MTRVPLTLTCGQIQQGKSTLSLTMAARECERTIILDPARSPAFDRVTLQFSSFDELATWLIEHGADYPRWVIALRSNSPLDYVRLLESAPYLRRVCILADEVAGIMGFDGAEFPFCRIAQAGANMGNGAGVVLSMTSQRPMNVPANVRSQVERVRSFRQREPRDLQWLSGFASPEFAEQVADLPDHKWIQFPPQSGAAREGQHDGEALAGVRGERASGSSRSPTVGEVQPHQQDSSTVQVTTHSNREETHVQDSTV